jgi:hypothetical protein
MEFIQRIINTLKRPKAAIEDISGTPFIEEAVMIVGIYGLLSAVSAYIISSKTVIIMEDIPALNPQLAGLIIMVTSIVIAFVVWFILTGTVHIISLAFGGHGRFYPEMMVLVGFAMLPLILNNIISMLIFSRMEMMSLTISQTNPSETQQAINDLHSRTPYLFSEITNFIIWVWTLAIIYLEVRIYQKLSRVGSLIAIAIPFVFILLQLIGWR